MSVETAPPKQITAKSEQDTMALAAQVAHDARPGDVFLLRGDLGSGKTVFARAFVRALSDDPATEVPSPTFTLVQIYDTSRSKIWHFDFYRIEDEGEIYNIGWEEALDGNIVLVEWPERLGRALPHPHREVFFHSVKNEPEWRRIKVTHHA